ncbi:preprotein translocase subunit SecA [Psychrobacillus sp. NPDC096426]|uniref:preprotein translocase subunit SecA n=1 Tax=Psychrobacillus sp. NPDC096426 TaxID=3364491 RepID=UPI003817DDA6
MLEGVKKLFNDSSKELKRINKIVDTINSLESKYIVYTDEELRGTTDLFKEQLSTGKTLKDIQIEAFAVVREAAKRVLGLRHYDVQLIGGFVLHEGSIAQMNTGEGKTLVSTLPSYLHALEGKGVHIITANEYLATRDRDIMGKVHEFLGLTVGLNIAQMSPHAKKHAYAADITYGTGTEFGFDYLRDNMVFRKEDKVQRGHHFAIVDEVDSILIDEARTPLIVAGKSNEGMELFLITAQIMKTFKVGKEYELIPETRHIYLTDEGATKIEKLFGIENLYDPEHRELLLHVNQSMKAYATLKRDVDYIVKEGKIELIDKFTGRIMEGRSLSEGLHQAIEAKEGVKITDENITQATITIQNYFRLYSGLAGMTGSATPSKKEFWETYRLPVVTIPTNKPVLREDVPELIYKDKENKIKKIVSEVKRINSLGRPILIGTTSIEQSEEFSMQLKKEKIKHTILNAKTEEAEADIIAQAGQKGQVMIATNMAGRGTDISLDEEVKQLGGLYIIGTERHESGRIDMQLRGRSGRQGDPGTSQFIISLEDDLFTYYDEEQHEIYLKKVKINEEGLVLSPNPDKYLKTVQETVEYIHQAAREHLLKLETPLNEQSKIIYSMRDRVIDLDSEMLFEELYEYMENYITRLSEVYFGEENEGLFDRQPASFIKELSLVLPSIDWSIEDIKHVTEQQVKMDALSKLEEQKALLELFKDTPIFNIQLKRLMLQQIDTNWMSHLHRMTNIREGIGLSGYGQQDPYQLFEKEALSEFKALLNEIESGVSIQFMELVKEVLKAKKENEQ